MPKLYPKETWAQRLRQCCENSTGRRLVLVLGAGVSLDPTGAGVWGVRRMVEELAKKAPNLVPKPNESLGDEYQDLMGAFGTHRGTDALTALVREAVLAASTATKEELSVCTGGPRDKRRAACRALQDKNERWRLPPAQETLARVLGTVLKHHVQHSIPCPCVVTTNFDGLLEVALDRAEVPYSSSGITRDRYPETPANKVEILHIHGCWHDQSMMHSKQALEAVRPGLRDALRDRLVGAEVFVLGYGGWQDIIFETLAELVSKSWTDDLPEILWAFFEEEDRVRSELENTRSAHWRILNRFKGPLAEHVHFFVGVDAHAPLEVPSIVPRATARVSLSHGASVEPRGATAVGPVSMPTEAPKDPSTDSVSAGTETRQSKEERRKQLGELIQEGLAELIATLPDGLTSPLEALVETSSPFDLCEVAAALSKTLRSILDEQLRTEFRNGARKLLLDALDLALGGVTPPKTREATVQIVKVNTAMSAESLLAKALNRAPMLVPHAHGARGEDVWYSEQHDGDFPEEGHQLNVEAKLWKHFHPNRREYSAKDYRAELMGKLRALVYEGRPLYALLRPGARRWRDIASGVPAVRFIELGAQEESLVDEYALAELIQDFLELEGR